MKNILNFLFFVLLLIFSAFSFGSTLYYNSTPIPNSNRLVIKQCVMPKANAVFGSQPDFLSSNYTTKNIFWKSGNAPNSASWDPRYKGNCTWYVYGRILDLGYSQEQLNAIAHGDAGIWYANANSNFSRSLGILVDKNPEVGAIAVRVSRERWTLGHVAVVENKKADNTITVSESCYSLNPQWNLLWQRRSCDSSWFDYYIHIYN